MEAFVDILAQVEAQYLVKHIMVPAGELVCAAGVHSAGAALNAHPEYNLVPIRRDGRLTEYLERGRPVCAISLYRDVVSDDASVLRLFDIFREREFAFVLADNAISGYVHFSDLNHRLVNQALFALVSVYEHRLAEELYRRIDGSDVFTLLTAPQLQRVEKLKERNVNLNWTTPLYFREILALAHSRNIVALEEKQIKSLNDVRNRICHANRLLVEKREDVRTIAEAKGLWLTYLTSSNALVQA